MGGISSFKGKERLLSGIISGVAQCMQAVPVDLNPSSRKLGTPSLSPLFLSDQPSGGWVSEAKEENT